jgi:hypothetical protein
MPNYVIIEHTSGHVWGMVKADSPIEACEYVDQTYWKYGREYEERACPDFCNEIGYFVYDGNNFEWPENADGTNKNFINSVSALPLIVFVRVTEKIL